MSYIFGLGGLIKAPRFSDFEHARLSGLGFRGFGLSGFRILNMFALAVLGLAVWGLAVFGF